MLSLVLQVGWSIAIKPLVFLLPVVLLARRETRRVGAWALVWVVALSTAAQAFMAVRAHSLTALSPLSAVKFRFRATESVFEYREAEPVQGELGDAPDRLGRGYKLTLGPA